MEAITEKISDSLTLLKHQIDHHHEQLKILSTNKFTIDTSPTGSGKTYTTIALAKKLDLTPLVISPRTLKIGWINALYDTKTNNNGLFTYESIRGNKNYQPSSNLLTRKGVEDSKNDAVFETTDKFDDLLLSGTLLVFDEFQKIMGVSGQMNACSALIQKILKTNTRSKIVFLSALAFDKEENSVIFFKLLGYIPQIINIKRIMNQSNNTELSNKVEKFVISSCEIYIDKNLTQKTLSNRRDKILPFSLSIFDLFKNVILLKTRSAMPMPLIESERDNKNGEYLYYEDSALAEFKKLNNYIKQLAALKQSSEESIRQMGFVEYTKACSLLESLVTKMFFKIQIKKIPIYSRLAIHRLETSPEAKVLIMLELKETMLYPLNELLKEYAPLLLHGDLKLEKREEVIRLFNTDPTRRLLIATMQTGGEGINLHDTVGNAPRYMFISPSFKHKLIHQTAGRIYRVGTKSRSTVRLVYAKFGDDSTESASMEMMFSKSNVANLITDLTEGEIEDRKKLNYINTELSGIIYPGQWPYEIETEIPKIQKKNKDSPSIFQQGVEFEDGSDDEGDTEGKETSEKIKKQIIVDTYGVDGDLPLSSINYDS